MGIEYLDKTHARLVVSKGSGENRIRKVKRITYKGKKDAERQYREFQNSLTQKVDESITVKELLEQYIQFFTANGGKETTIRAYNIASKPIILALGRVCAKSVQIYNIENFIKEEQNKRSPKTIRNEITLLSSAYNYAIRRGMLSENPCQYAVLPRQTKPDIDILSETDIDRFCKALDTAPIDFKVMCELALFCGLRRSEIYGLKKSDISDTLTVERVRHHMNGKDIIETPKTLASHRTLSVPKFILKDIDQMKEAQKSRPEQSEFLVLNDWGEPPASYWCDKHLHKLISENDLPHITMHGLRHTYASMLINAGVPITDVSHQLGHSSVDITLRIYTHLFKKADVASQHISNLIDEKMSPKNSKKKKNGTKMAPKNKR